MNKKRLQAFVLAMTMFFSVGCGSEIGTNKGIITTVKPEPVETQADITESSQTDDSNKEEINIPSYDEIKIKADTATYVSFSQPFEAEEGKISEIAKISDTRKDFKGKGYVANIKKQSDWNCEFDIKNNQYYNIEIIAASDADTRFQVYINKKSVGTVTYSKKGKWQTMILNNVKLTKGKAKLSIVPAKDTAVDVDFCKITASDEISKLKNEIKDPKLSNKNADYNAKALYSYISECFGKNVILGQHDTVGTNAETDLIYRTTGKYPAIRFGDMTLFTQKNSELAKNELPCAEKWAEQGGIIGYMWHWTDPVEKKEYYSDKTEFNLKKAVTKEDIANLSIEQIRQLQKEGKVSSECVAIVEDIDTVSEQLAKLRDEGIAVLWRPLHEASNGYFWWGKDAESYKWLWKLMYKRQTEFHKLNNLIWVWSAQNAAWYVGDEYCDIVSADVYDDGSKESQINSLLFLKSISANKPAAMSECGNFPSIQNIADDKAQWSYIGQWGGNFLMTDEGELSEQNNTASDLITMYNNNITITRDKLPDLKKLAEDIKSREESGQKSDDSSKSESSSEKDSSSKADSSSSKSDKSKKSDSSSKKS